MNYKNNKAVSGGDRNGFQNHLIAGGNQKDFQIENTINIEKLQSKVLGCINQKPRKVYKLFPCHSCKNSYVPEKLAAPNICKN